MEVKKGPKKGDINELLGKEVVKIIKNGVQNVFNETGKIIQGKNISDFSKETTNLIYLTYYIVFIWGLEHKHTDANGKEINVTYNDLYDANKNKIGPNALINEISENETIKSMLEDYIDANDRKQFKDWINDNINEAIDSTYLGGKGLYKRLIEQGKQKRAKREAEYEEKYNLANIL